MNDAVIVWAVQATAALAIGMAVALALRSRAALGHVMLVLAMIAVAAIPAASWIAARAGVGMLAPVQIAAGETRGGEVAGPPLLPEVPRGVSGGSGVANSVVGASVPPVVETNVATASQRGALHWGNVAMSVWGAMLVVASGRFLLRSAQAIGIRVRSGRVSHAAIQQAMERSATELGLGRGVELRVSEGAGCPMIWCWGRPVVIVPAGFESLDVDWDAVMMHELAHLRRRDHAWALLAELLVCAMPWNPLAWAVRRRLFVLAEMACDDWAVRMARSAAGYADSLLAFAAVPRRALAPAIVTRSGLSRRIARILGGAVMESRVNRRIAVGAACIAGLGGTLAALARPREAGKVEVAAPAVPTVQPEKRAETADKPAEKGPVDVQVRLNALVETWKQNGGTSPKLWEIARELSGSGDARIIPTMIGVIDADQSYNTVYGLGYFGLSTITGVKYSAFHDGAWWRRWWEASKQRFPEAAGIAIPEYPKTEFAAKYVPFPADLDTYDGLIRKLLADYPNAKESNTDMSHIAEQLVRINNPRAIPVLIGVIDADNSYATVYGLGYFGLGRMTDVAYSPFHDGAWWRRWWEANKQRYHAAAGEAIPEYPKTAHGAKYVAYPADQDTYDGLIRKLLGDYARAAASDLNLSDIAQELVRINDPRAIPVLIGVIDADNSYATVYGLGYFGLGRMTKVSYSPYHDGAWWRRWWEANKEKYPEAARNTPIPELAKTEHGKAYVPMPESFETLDGKVGWLREGLAAGRPVQWMQIAEALASHNDARAIPVMIGIIEGENTEATIYGVGYFGLSKLAGVKYDKSHDGAWWRRWWEENKGGLPREAQDVAIPDFKELIAGWAKGAAGRERAEVEARFTGYPAEKVAIGGDAKKTYFLIGPAQAQKPPEKGWKLLLILPGGDGGEAFHPFCRSIHKEALPEGYVAAELVAHAWSKDENRTVWPTGKMNRDGAEFTTEEFIKDVVADVSRRMKVDSSKVYALGWSSSGPALYCDSLQGSPITGYFIAMSVFRTQWMGDIAGAKGKKYYILHSPDDKMIPIAQHAREAERKLREAGAEAVVTEYAGGHGWTEDPFGNIRKGIVWLEGR